MQRIRKISAFLTIGLFIMGLAVFAGRLGLDPNPSWGKGRIAILLVGLLIAIFAFVKDKRFPNHETTSAQSDLFIFPIHIFVIAIYVWFVSISHTATSNYYALLGTSFRRGELSLPLKPDPALLKLSNPYDPSARQNIKVPLDLSLYKGKYYLYWGPAPALILASVDPLFHGSIDDGYLIIVFLCGLFLAQSLLIMIIWERFFHDIPKWIVIISILLAGLASPATWLLNKPKIYETAIAGGQFFLISAFLAALTALDRTSPSKWRLALAGILWAFAVGTRLVLILPVAFMTLMVIYWFYKTNFRSLFEFAVKLIPLGLPLVIGALSLGWYNWARFGSISETGITYQLAGPYLQRHLGELFSPAYILQNFYNYLLNPFGLNPERQFPFIFPERGRLESVFYFYALPKMYFAQPITGLLCATPFTIFAAISIVASLKQFFKKEQALSSNKDSDKTILNWITTSLIGSFLSAFILLLIFFWTAMRYMEDFMPALILLGIIGFWNGYVSLSSKDIGRKFYSIFGIILAGTSIVISTLLGLSGSIIRSYLADQILRFFQR